MKCLQWALLQWLNSKSNNDDNKKRKVLFSITLTNKNNAQAKFKFMG